MSEEDKEWEKKSLPSVTVAVEDIDLYLSYEYSMYEAMDPSELIEIIWSLKKYSLEMKIKYNKEKSKSKWFYTTINKIAKPECQQYKSYDKDERFYSVIKGNDTLKKYLEQKITSDYRADLIDGIEKEINNLTYILKNLHDYKISKMAFKKGEQNDYSDD